MNTLKDLREKLLETSLEEDCIYFVDEKLILKDLANNGNFEIYTSKVCNEVYFGIDYNIYKGNTTIMYEDIKSLPSIYFWVISIMKMNQMKIL